MQTATGERGDAPKQVGASRLADRVMRRARYAARTSSPFTAGAFSRSAARHDTAVTTHRHGANPISVDGCDPETMVRGCARIVVAVDGGAPQRKS